MEYFTGAIENFAWRKWGISEQQELFSLALL
jgi:hypothetical protein